MKQIDENELEKYLEEFSKFSNQDLYGDQKKESPVDGAKKENHEFNDQGLYSGVEEEEMGEDLFALFL